MSEKLRDQSPGKEELNNRRQALKEAIQKRAEGKGRILTQKAKAMNYVATVLLNSIDDSPQGEIDNLPQGDEGPSQYAMGILAILESAYHVNPPGRGGE